MLKPLTTIYKDQEITLECTHKKVFPPPQMYGSTLEDIDNLWKQGAIDQKQHQHLTTWKDNCGLMVMGPRCLDCPLALKQNPRPGRPHVIETAPWLATREKMHWDAMKAAKPPLKSEPEKTAAESAPPESEEPAPAPSEDTPKETQVSSDSTANPDSEVVPEDTTTQKTTKISISDEIKVVEDPGLEDDFLSALAED